MKRLVLVACVVVVAVVLGRRWAKYRSPTATFKTMIKAAEAGDRDALIACHDEEGRACYEEIHRLRSEAMGRRDVDWPPMRAAPPQKGIVYGKETFNGDTATLEVTRNRRTETVLFKKEGLAWKFHAPELRDMVEAWRRRNREMGKNAGERKGMGHPAGERKGMAKNMGAPHPRHDSPRPVFEALVEAAAEGDKSGLLACCDRETGRYLQEFSRLQPDATRGRDRGMEMIASYKGSVTIYGKEVIRGDSATLEVTTDGRFEVVRFRREGGDWKFHDPQLRQVVESLRRMRK